MKNKVLQYFVINSGYLVLFVIANTIFIHDYLIYGCNTSETQTGKFVLRFY